METRVCRIRDVHDIRIETTRIEQPGPGEVMVAVSAGGICGSDLHYFHEFALGPFRIQGAMILGHEAAGTIIALGDGVTDLEVGTHVAINPSRPCMNCDYCLKGMTTHCQDMRFRGSAMRVPHYEGLFRDRIVLEAEQCVPVGNVDLSAAACAEPLAVCLHARHMAGDLMGKRVLVTGAGPIGALCSAVAAQAGAAEIVTTDLQDVPLGVAEALGATEVINMSRNGARMERFSNGKGHFDVVFECSGASPAIQGAMAAVRPQGRIVQVGTGGQASVPLSAIVGKEMTWQGTQRFRHIEFHEAVRLIRTGGLDVSPMVTGQFPLEEATTAFETAGDRSRAVKVHLMFEGA
ncbi:L-idonate 5-dehydrogenase [Pacificoceanicola onchidii]|uniref:L-idonate 5-dehydrogenase n=1 Tax=Pacificoceanicola onchidii TaxID=2562685 RepID=UPI0010A2AD92|nr:L-idonate 5-dehydrogenase [Pacificoceanicola onchidii]